LDREFSYESPGKRNFKWSTFGKVIVKHQVAYFFGTQCTITLHLLLQLQDGSKNVRTLDINCVKYLNPWRLLIWRCDFHL